MRPVWWDSSFHYYRSIFDNRWSALGEAVIARGCNSSKAADVIRGLRPRGACNCTRRPPISLAASLNHERWPWRSTATEVVALDVAEQPVSRLGFDDKLQPAAAAKHRACVRSAGARLGHLPTQPLDRAFDVIDRVRNRRVEVRRLDAEHGNLPRRFGASRSI